MPQIGIDTPRIRQHTADYYNCISRLDTGVGLALAAVDRSGKAEDTLVIFTTDHGAQFSRGKMCIYEGGLRVPLIVRHPGGDSGEVRDDLTSHVDILPTIAEATGVEAPSGAGRSILRLIVGSDAGNAGSHDFQFAEWCSASPVDYFPQRSVRDHRYKLIVNFLGDLTQSV